MGATETRRYEGSQELIPFSLCLCRCLPGSWNFQSVLWAFGVVSYYVRDAKTEWCYERSL